MFWVADPGGALLRCGGNGDRLHEQRAAAVQTGRAPGPRLPARVSRRSLRWKIKLEIWSQRPRCFGATIAVHRGERGMDKSQAGVVTKSKGAGDKSQGRDTSVMGGGETS